MATKVNVTDNLLIRTILSPMMNFSGSTQGEINKQTLVNRVKKLDQSDRQELMTQLEGIFERVNGSEELKPTDLREKGLAVLLLWDDGIPLEKVGFFEWIIRSISSTFGSRIRSADIVEKLGQVRTSLERHFLLPLENKINEGTDIVDLLNTSIEALKREQVTPDENRAKRKLNKKLLILDKGIERLPVNSWVQSRGVEERYTHIIASVSRMCELVEENPDVYNNSVLFGRRMKFIRIALGVLHVAPDDKTIAKFILESPISTTAAVSKNDKEVLEAIRDGQIVRGMKNYNGNYAKLFLMTYVRRQLQSARAETVGEIQNPKRREEEIESDILAVQLRLEKFERNRNLKIERLVNGFDLSMIQVAQEEAQKALDNIESILWNIDFLSKAKGKSFGCLKGYAEARHMLVARGQDDEIKKTENFSDKLFYIKNIMVDLRERDHMEMARDIQLEQYPSMKNLPCYAVLNEFITVKFGHIGEGEQEYRMKLVGAYLEYLSIMFTEKKRLAQAALTKAKEQLKETAEKKNALLKNSAPQPPVQKHAQTASANTQKPASAARLQTPPPAVTPKPVAHIVPPKSIVPEHAPVSAGNKQSQAVRELLVPIAKGIEANGANDAAAKFHYSKVKGLTAEGLHNVVFYNFYEIMNKAGKIKKSDGKWGELVFEGRQLSELVNPMSVEELNKYRLQALLKAIGETKTS